VRCLLSLLSASSFLSLSCHMLLCCLRELHRSSALWRTWGSGICMPSFTLCAGALQRGVSSPPSPPPPLCCNQSLSVSEDAPCFRLVSCHRPAVHAPRGRWNDLRCCPAALHLHHHFSRGGVRVRCCHGSLVRLPCRVPCQAAARAHVCWSWYGWGALCGDPLLTPCSVPAARRADQA
jgi:hypothetical protein